LQFTDICMSQAHNRRWCHNITVVQRHATYVTADSWDTWLHCAFTPLHQNNYGGCTAATLSPSVVVAHQLWSVVVKVKRNRADRRDMPRRVT
jgi:hypothetical protein